MIWRIGSAILFAAVALFGCTTRNSVPEVDSPAYREVVLNFYSAAARIQTGSEAGAMERLQRAAEIAPGEPAIWFNMAVLSFRRGDAATAAQFSATALEKDPNNTDILLLSGLIELQRQERQDALVFLERAVAADSNNVQALYTLATTISESEVAYPHNDPARLLEAVLRKRPNNTAALIEAMRRASERGDQEKSIQLMSSIDRITAEWPDDVRDQIEALRAAVVDKQPAAFIESAVLRASNVMKSVDAHRANLAEVDVDMLDPALVMTRFVRLATPSGRPSPADSALTFERKPLMPQETRWDWLGSVFLSGDGPLAAVAVNSAVIRIEPNTLLPFPGSDAKGPPEHPIAFLDYDYDFRMDLAAAGAAGLKIYRQESDGSFTDRTRDAGLMSTDINHTYSGVWTLDIDLEGDMDLVLATTAGPIRLLRNNGEGTFAAQTIFSEASHVRDMVWADLDDDGDPDAVLLDKAGSLHLFKNERSGFFAHSMLHVAGTSAALHVDDIDADGRFDVIVLQHTGEVLAVAEATETPVISRILDDSGFRPKQNAFARLSTSDLDNNGGADLVVSVENTSAIWLRSQDRHLTALTRLDLRVQDQADIDQDGVLNLLALDANGSAEHLVNKTSLDYLSRSILPRAADAVGDRRINSFGIGGEIELRADLLYQKRVIDSPLIHFGLGDRQIVDVARIDWPNGTSQADFDLASDQELIATQSLKGSCPWVFTFDGDRMRFVTDFLWRSPLGLRINAVETAGIATTEDWVKIDGDELASSDGIYDLRITAELWETHFFDLVELRAIDHPEGTEIFVNEVFVFPPRKLAVHVTGELQKIAGAWDQDGRNVTDLVAQADGQYLDLFELYSHQGLTHDHFIEVELGQLPTDTPLWLVASGWIRPTDSSINVALGQGDHPQPRGVRLEVLEDSGQWTTVYPDLGFPAGKTKTMLVDLTDVFESRSSRRIRLSTNLEIYWDKLAWAEAADSRLAQTTVLDMKSADLRYRGFSHVLSGKRSTAEVPVYDSLAASTQQWRDLVGYHTRFGDVTELLASVDDRYVIMNAGDELAFGFEATASPRDGWERDFVLLGDGWVKDGDYNTTFSKTVLPLPEHAVTRYEEPLLRLTDNPTYQRHPEDWSTYHTRYVTPQNFAASLRTR